MLDACGRPTHHGGQPSNVRPHPRKSDPRIYLREGGTIIWAILGPGAYTNSFELPSEKVGGSGSLTQTLHVCHAYMPISWGGFRGQCRHIYIYSSPISRVWVIMMSWHCPRVSLASPTSAVPTGPSDSSIAVGRQVSMAICRAGAAVEEVPLYQQLGGSERHWWNKGVRNRTETG